MGLRNDDCLKGNGACAGLFQPLRHSKSWWNFHWKEAKEMGVSCQFMGSKRGSVEVLQDALWTWNAKFCCTACLARQLSQRLLQVVRLNEIGYYVPRMYALILWCRSTHFHKRLCWHGFYIFLPGRCCRVCLKNRGPQNQLHATAPGHPKHHAQELEGPLAFGEFKWFSFRLVFGDVHIWNWRDDFIFGINGPRFPWEQLKLETSSKFPIGLAVVFGAVWLFLDQVQGSLLLLQLVPKRLKDTCCQKSAQFFGENLCCAWGNNVADEGCRVLFDAWLVLVVTCDIHVLGVRTRTWRFESNSC